MTFGGSGGSGGILVCGQTRPVGLGVEQISRTLTKRQLDLPNTEVRRQVNCSARRQKDRTQRRARVEEMAEERDSQKRRGDESTDGIDPRSRGRSTQPHSRSKGGKAHRQRLMTVPENRWAFKLAPQLSGRAQQAYAALSGDSCHIASVRCERRDVSTAVPYGFDEHWRDDAGVACETGDEGL